MPSLTSPLSNVLLGGYPIFRISPRASSARSSAYNIRVIPTQVFLDQNGRELMRHEGFFPEKDIDDFLQSKGLKPKPAVKD